MCVGILTEVSLVLVCSEYSGWGVCVSLPAGEVENLPAEPGGEELPHLLQAVCRSS